MTPLGVQEASPGAKLIGTNACVGTRARSFRQAATGATKIGVLGFGQTGVWGYDAVAGVTGSTLDGGAYAYGVQGYAEAGVAGAVGGTVDDDNDYSIVAEDSLGVPGAGRMYAASYEPFTGSHVDLIARDDPAQPGDILVDTGTVFKESVVNCTSIVARSSAPRQRGAVGVLYRRGPIGRLKPAGVTVLVNGPRNNQTGRVPRGRALDPLAAGFLSGYDGVINAALGEGQVNVCGEGGDIAVGDLIVTSSIPGKGMRQADDIVRSYTVAKAREAVTFGRPDEVKMIACTYHAG